MPHQAAGVKWLLDAVDRGGGLLTDEPGLGKTLQAVTLIEALIASRRVARVLIVVPANVCASPQPCLVRCSSCSCASCRPCALSCQLLGARAHALRSRPPSAPARPTRVLTRACRVANWENEFHRWLGGTAFELSVSKVAKTAAKSE